MCQLGILISKTVCRGHSLIKPLSTSLIHVYPPSPSISLLSSLSPFLYSSISPFLCSSHPISLLSSFINLFIIIHQELEKLSAEKTFIENESEKRAAKIKSIEEDRNRLQKSASTQQSAVVKQKQVVDDLKSKLMAAETLASTLKRQNEQLQRDVKTQQSNVGATEVGRAG